MLLAQGPQNPKATTDYYKVLYELCSERCSGSKAVERSLHRHIHKHDKYFGDILRAVGEATCTRYRRQMIIYS